MRSWQASKAIAKRWEECELDDAFKAYWKDDKKSRRKRFEPLSYGEARPNTPFPYCVLEILPSPILGRSVGREPRTQIEYRDLQIQFRIHAQECRETGRDPKDIADDLAPLIDEAFGPPERLDMRPYGFHNQTLHGDDFPLRTGATEFMLAINYIYKVECVIDLRCKLERDLDQQSSDSSFSGSSLSSESSLSSCSSIVVDDSFAVGNQNIPVDQDC